MAAPLFRWALVLTVIAATATIDVQGEKINKYNALFSTTAGDYLARYNL